MRAPLPAAERDELAKLAVEHELTRPELTDTHLGELWAALPSELRAAAPLLAEHARALDRLGHGDEAERELKAALKRDWHAALVKSYGEVHGADAAKQAGEGRTLYFCAENERQEARQARKVVDGGNGMDALWNDDFHHAAMVRLTGKNPAYYSDYLGTVNEFAAALKHGFLYQGQRSRWQQAPRGTHCRQRGRERRHRQRKAPQRAA